jgi:hypothetical protein
MSRIAFSFLVFLPFSMGRDWFQSLQNALIWPPKVFKYLFKKAIWVSKTAMLPISFPDKSYRPKNFWTCTVQYQKMENVLISALGWYFSRGTFYNFSNGSENVLEKHGASMPRQRAVNNNTSSSLLWRIFSSCPNRICIFWYGSSLTGWKVKALFLGIFQAWRCVVFNHLSRES